MATLDEVSARLMKPAKDLADWNFPLAMVLEEYYTLLNEQGDVNFSNAALVLQNSANVYVRRVEYVFHDTSSLNESVAKHEAVDKAKKDAKKGAKDTNALIDFGDFETIDFTQFVGKNNNMKARTGANNSVKLLSQRFPQLENISRSSLPIEVYDIHGEVVGRKYDFRCNEYLTASGMLVEHLTPEDFPNGSSKQSTNIPRESPDNVIDIIASLESTQSARETDNEIHGHGLCQDGGVDSSVVHDKDTGLLDTSFASSFDSGVGSSIQCSDMRPESSLSNFAENHWEPSQSRPGSSLSTADANCLVGEDSAPLDSSQNNTISAQQNVQNTEKRSREAMQSEDSPLDNSSADGREHTGDSAADTEAGSPLEGTQEVAVTQVRRSKRLKRENVIDAVNDLNPKLWEPIPFNGVPDKLPKSRTEFKLPCPISLLKFKKRPRKRKVTTQMQKKLCLERLSTIECGTARKKMTMYSPTRQIFLPFKKEELEVFQKCFEERFKNRSNLDAFDYEAVTDITMDLLGFRTKVGKSDRDMIATVESDINEFSLTNTCIEEQLTKRLKVEASNYEAVTNISKDLLGFKTSVAKSDSVIHGIVTSISDTTESIESMESVVDDFPMPDTPESSDSSLETEIPSSNPPSTYHSRIEQSVRDIYDSADVRTAQEEAVARWHEFMKPKLREAERRPPFDMSQYSARVIENMKLKNDRKIEFKEMVNHHEPTEVARYFLASLQLANKYNLHIDTSRNVEGNFTLVLLDKDRSGNY